MKKFGTITLIFLLALVWYASIALAQELDERTQSKVLSAQLPSPLIELAGQIGGSANDSWLAQNVTVADNVAYVGGGDGLRLIDISSPANPSELGFYPIGGTGEVVLAGNLACVLNGYKVRFIDISNPAIPDEIGSYTFPLPQFPDAPVDIAVLDNIAYVVRFGTGLYLLDISNPATPTLIGSYDSPNRTFGVAITGNTAYLAGGQSGLSIIDLSNTAIPSPVGSHPGLVGWSNDIAIAENKVYLADSLFDWGGLSIIDVAIPTHPKMFGSIALGDAAHVTVQGAYAYLLIAGDLHIVDISDPRNPVEIGFYDNNVVWWVDDLDVKNKAQVGFQGADLRKE